MLAGIMDSAGVRDDYVQTVGTEAQAYVWIGATDNFMEDNWIWDGDNDSVGTQFWRGEGTRGDDDGVVIDDLYNNWCGTEGNRNEPRGEYLQDAGGIILNDFVFFDGVQIRKGQWSDIRTNNELYFVIEYDCTEEFRTEIDTSICSGEEIFIAGEFRTRPGIYYDTLTTEFLCDSIIITELEVIDLDSDVELVNKNLVSGEEDAESYILYNCDTEQEVLKQTDRIVEVTETGNYKLIVEKNDCRDESECFFVCIPTIEETQHTICTGEEFEFRGNTYNESGIYADTLSQTGFDCDSIFSLDLTVIEFDTTIQVNNNRMNSLETNANHQWYNCDTEEIVPGATNRVFIPTENGNYSVILTNEGCKDTSECYYMLVTSVEDENNSIVQYSSATNQLSVNTTDIYSLKIYDINGSTILERNNTRESLINISNLQKGMYIARFEFKTGPPIVKKIIKW